MSVVARKLGLSNATIYTYRGATPISVETRPQHRGAKPNGSPGAVQEFRGQKQHSIQRYNLLHPFRSAQRLGAGYGTWTGSATMTKAELEALLARLDPDRERAGEEYEQIRRKLVTFLGGRGVTNAEDAADETINRVARKLREGEVVRNINAYFLGVAGNVASEIFKKIKELSLSDVGEPRGNPIDYERQQEEQEEYRRMRCVQKALTALLFSNGEDYKLIIEWHLYEKGKKIENRRRLAAERQIRPGTLSVHVHRVLKKLQLHVEKCLRQFSGVAP